MGDAPDDGDRARTDCDRTVREWDSRYAAGTTFWDLGRPSPVLMGALALDPSLGVSAFVDGPRRAVVPGCGRGWDAAALAAAGWDVVGVDIAPRALAEARSLHPGVAFVEADALDPAAVLEVAGGPVDLLFDHTFFCALPLVMRPRFGHLARSVVRAGGAVASVVFPIGLTPAPQGPPFPMTVDDVTSVLGEVFEASRVAGPVLVDGRRWPHRWATWRHLGS